MDMKLTAHLSFPGCAEEAAKFYRSILGGEFSGIIKYEDIAPNDYKSNPTEGRKIVNLDYNVGDLQISIGDQPAGIDIDYGKNGVILQLNFSHSEEIDPIFKKLSHGGKILHPLKATEWNTRFGMLTDKYGVTWALMAE